MAIFATKEVVDLDGEHIVLEGVGCRTCALFDEKFHRKEATQLFE